MKRKGLCVKYSWDDIEKRNFKNYTILLDIDGVLLSEAENKIAPEIIKRIDKLKQDNDVLIVSNTIFKKRCIYVSLELKIQLVSSPYKKPSAKILPFIKRDKSKPLIMIGDKFLTDGIFAKRIKAEPILIKRRIHKKDNPIITFTYKIDDFVYYLLKTFFCSRKNR